MKTAILIAGFLVASPAVALPICGHGKRVSCVVDGDTFWLGGVKYRLKGIDTPEKREKCSRGRKVAREAANALSEALSAGNLYLETFGKGQYGRVLVKVSVGGVDVGEMLLARGLARRWPDGERWWCR